MALKFGEGYVPIFLTGMGAFRGGLSKARVALTQSIHSMEAVARRARIGFLLGAAIGVGVTKAAAGFEQGMARVRALTGATGEDFASLQTQALLLGRTTVFSARQAADAMSFFALAGFKANQIVTAMPATLNLAAAGQLEVAQAADIAAKIMAGMGLEASELSGVVDVLAKGFTSANTDLGQLGNAMRFVGPVGKAAGKDIEELVAAIQVMSNAGIQGAQAGAALRNILIRLQAQPSEVKKALRAMGIEIADSIGRMRHLADIVDDVRRATSQMGEVQRNAIISQLAGIRATAAFAAMMEQGGSAIRMFEAELDNAGGTAERIARIQLDTFTGSLIFLKSATEGLAIALGERLIPVLRNLADRLTAAASRWANMTDDQKRATVATFGMFMRLTALLVIMPQVAIAAGAFGLALVGLGGPATLAIVGLSAAVSGLVVAFVDAKIRGESLQAMLAHYVAQLEGVESSLDRQAKASQVLAEAQDARNVAVEEELNLRERIARLLGVEEKQKDKAAKEPPKHPEIVAAEDRLKAEEEALAEFERQAKFLEEEVYRKYLKQFTKASDSILDFRKRNPTEVDVEAFIARMALGQGSVSEGNNLWWQAIELYQTRQKVQIQRGTVGVAGGRLQRAKELVVVAGVLQNATDLGNAVDDAINATTRYIREFPVGLGKAAGRAAEALTPGQGFGLRNVMERAFGVDPSFLSQFPLRKKPGEEAMFMRPSDLRAQRQEDFAAIAADQRKRLKADREPAFAAEFTDPMQFWKSVQQRMGGDDPQEMQKKTADGVLSLVDIEKETRDLLKDIKERLPPGLAKGK